MNVNKDANPKPKISSWIGRFLERHRARFNPPDWPAADTEAWDDFTKGWIRAFALKFVAEGEAEEASCRLTLDPPKWRQDHIPAVVRQVEAIRAERQSIPAPPPIPSGPSADNLLPPEVWAEAEALWARLDEADREQWRAAVRARFPRMPAAFVGPLACWWCYDPQQVPPLAPPVTGPARGPRHAFAGYDPAIGTPAAHSDV